MDRDGLCLYLFCIGPPWVSIHSFPLFIRILCYTTHVLISTHVPELSVLLYPFLWSSFTTDPFFSPTIYLLVKFVFLFIFVSILVLHFTIHTRTERSRPCILHTRSVITVGLSSLGPSPVQFLPRYWRRFLAIRRLCPPANFRDSFSLC